jgi:hypothetical protein
MLYLNVVNVDVKDLVLRPVPICMLRLAPIAASWHFSTSDLQQRLAENDGSFLN